MSGIRHAWRATVRRWKRGALTVAAMAAGAAALVSMLAVSQSSAEHVVDKLNAFESTSISAALPASAWLVRETDIIGRTMNMTDVHLAGTLSLPAAGGPALPVSRPETTPSADAGVAVATAMGLAARGVVFLAGGNPSDGVLDRDPRLVVVGVALAKQIGVSTDPGLNRITISGASATVVGIVADGPGHSQLSTAIVMAPQAARHFGVLPATRNIQVGVAAGAADEVGGRLALALWPREPSAVSVVVPPSPARLRSQLTADARSLVFVVSLVTAGATLFGIVTTMQISVWERRKEIGLSRALGMPRVGVAATFLWESVMLGAVGSLLGWAVGVLIARTIAAASGWPFILPIEAMGVPFLGAVVGGVAGIFPARSAAKVDPADLLRG